MHKITYKQGHKKHNNINNKYTNINIKMIVKYL